MILLKICGSVAIIAGSFFLGYVLSCDFKKRPQQLRELQGMLLFFENEISFMSNILKDALFKTGICNKSATSLFFIEASELLTRDRMNAQNAWKESIEKNIIKTSLDFEDQSILKAFGNMLGNSDFDGQVKNIRLVVAQLKIQETKAEELKKKNEYIYRKLTTLCGIALVIILI